MDSRVGRDRIMSDRSRCDNFDRERATWKSAEKLISHRRVTPRTLLASEPQHKLLYKRFHILRKELSRRVNECQTDATRENEELRRQLSEARQQYGRTEAR